MNLRDLLPKTTNGSLHIQWRRCGRKNCRCAEGFEHGPYAVLRFRQGRKQRALYIPMNNLATAAQELGDIKVGRQLSVLRRELKDLAAWL